MEKTNLESSYNLLKKIKYEVDLFKNPSHEIVLKG